MRIGLSGASTISVRCTSRAERVEHGAATARARRRPTPARTRPTSARSGIAQITIASVSVDIATRNAPTHCRPSASTAGRPVSASASRNARAPPTGQLHELVRVHRALHARLGELVDRRAPRLGHDDAVEAAAPQLGRDRPPLRERRVLRAAARRARARSWRPARSSRRAPTGSRPAATRRSTRPSPTRRSSACCARARPTGHQLAVMWCM